MSSKNIISGARNLPLRHISIRVPWNDTGWEGKTCKSPGENISCLILPRIRASRDDKQETLQAGKSWEDFSQDQLPPCVAEHGHFMASYEITRELVHPYVKNGSKAHKHIAPTPFRHAPFSAAAIPFKWMLRSSAEEIVQKLELGYQPELEDEADKVMGFNTSWVQVKDNQLVMLDTYFSAIKPKKSLVFFYAKRTPLVDDTRRVIIGAGWVTHVGNSVEYQYKEPGPLQSSLWERNIHHSIRNDFKNGFLLPYQAVNEYLQIHPDVDPTKYVAFVPDDQFLEYSYGSDHVTNDGAIGSLLSCAKAIRNTQEIVPGPWKEVLAWVDVRLNELWEMRGPYPGLGSALTAFGVENGSLVAFELEQIIAEQKEENIIDPWQLADQLFRTPEKFPDELSNKIGNTLQTTWENLAEERRSLLKLISRFDLMATQAIRYYVHEDKQRTNYQIEVKDAELLANPYRLYELDRITPDPISLSTIDRGVFPDESVRKKYFSDERIKISDALDPRRVCSFVIRQLEAAANNGDTLRSRDQVIQEIRELDVQPGCPVTGDMMGAIEGTFEPRVHIISLDDQRKGYQVDHLFKASEKIRISVKKRIKGARHKTDDDWGELLGRAFNVHIDLSDQQEKDARQEKVAALQELFSSRFSVLIGAAGTGKTTLLKVLCRKGSIAKGGVLLLAPTGKARVRMETQTTLRAKTIAQFLLPLDRYEPTTGTYRFSQTNLGTSNFKTVIIDEASMLTDDQLAAVLDAVKGVERIILVGDPKQLPPIGAGRPFLDIVTELEPDNVQSLFPRVSPGYAELTVRRRQTGQNRDDLLLAEWFSGRELDPGADEIWQKIQEGNYSPTLKFVEWDKPEDLQGKILDTLVKELHLKNICDTKKFEMSLGGTEYMDNVFFWAGRKHDQPGACGKIEDWQILSPIRNTPYGVEALNRLIQSTFRGKTKEFALLPPYLRRIPKPMGREEILYGDKVIQTRNEHRHNVFPKNGSLKYVANGEIGIVVGQYKSKNVKFTPYALDVEFSSQPHTKYSYFSNEFGEEARPKLELAYALTIHKAQGSEFGLTFLIVPNPNRLLSRELLYTALTRQRDRIVVFHQGPVSLLKDYADDYHSSAASRLTNIFTPSKPVSVQDRFLAYNLIHRTGSGLCVRSKSEVIIATELEKAGIEYTYESKFIGQDGSYRYPDFLIDDAESGVKYIWEHLGMLRKPDYCQRQLEKDMATIRNAQSYCHGEAHASCELGTSLIRFAASSALWLGTSFPNSTMMLW